MYRTQQYMIEQLEAFFSNFMIEEYITIFSLSMREFAVEKNAQN